MKQGVYYYVTFNHKPSQKEAIYALADKIENKNTTTSDTLEKCCISYTEARSNTISPNTSRSYYGYIHMLPDKFRNIKLSNFSQLNFQQLINEYSTGRKYKTVKNFYNFISGVLSTFTNYKYKVALPKPIKKDSYIPTLEDVKKIIDEADNQYKIIFTLGSYGLRYGEIQALTSDDVHEDFISVTKSVAYGVGYKKIIKAPKTYESNREVQIPHELYLKIKKDGLKVPSERQCLRTLYKIQDKLKIPRFVFHKFRHFLASYLHSQGVPSKNIMAIGGWASDHIMKSVYTHAYKVDKPIYLPL